MVCCFIRVVDKDLVSGAFGGAEGAFDEACNDFMAVFIAAYAEKLPCHGFYGIQSIVFGRDVEVCFWNVIVHKTVFIVVRINVHIIADITSDLVCSFGDK